MRRYFDSNPVRLKPRIQNRKGENTSTNIIRQDRTVLIQNQHVFNNARSTLSPRKIDHAAKIPERKRFTGTHVHISQSGNSGLILVETLFA